MKILLALSALLALAIAIVLVLAARKPDVFSVQRSITINASAARIFPLIDDLRAHETWSPFDKPDPATRKTYTGSAAGVGSVYAWEGSGKSGAGRIAIIESSPDSKITMQLDMLKPFKASNVVLFTLEPAGTGTRVTWSMQGKNPFLGKIMHVFVDMDRMVGGGFETGLANLKTIAEQ
ncbi:MAG TPA: SRPBCC family protein [Pseudoxanthomonas sp.]